MTNWLFLHFISISNLWALGPKEVTHYQKDLPASLLAPFESSFSFLDLAVTVWKAALLESCGGWINWSLNVWRFCMLSLCRTGISWPVLVKHGDFAVAIAYSGTVRGAIERLIVHGKQGSLRNPLFPFSLCELWEGGLRDCAYICGKKAFRAWICKQRICKTTWGCASVIVSRWSS